MNDEIKQCVGQYLERELKAMVNEKVQAEEELRFRQLKWIAAFIGIIGLGSIGTLTNFFIEKIVEEKIAKTNEDIERATELLRFSGASLRLGVDDERASQESVDQIMRYLREAKKDSKIYESSGFKMSLFQAIYGLKMMHKAASIDEIFGLYEREIMSTPYLVEVCIVHYGLEVVSKEVVSEDDPRYKIFSKLESAAVEAGVSGIALAYRVLFESKKPFDENSKVVIMYLKRSLSLVDKDRKYFFRMILLYSRASNFSFDWEDDPASDEQSIQDVTLRFLQMYKDSINKFYKIVYLESWDGAVLNGIDVEGAKTLAAKISASKYK